MKKKRLLSWLCCALVLGMNFSPILAQTEFRTALKNKYGFRTVSCYVCHSRKADLSADQHAAYTENSKQFRNELGKMFEEHLKGKNVTARLNAVKGLSSDDPKKEKVKEEVTKEFLEALEEVEKMPFPDGGNYAEALKAGKVKDIKLGN